MVRFKRANDVVSVIGGAAVAVILSFLFLALITTLALQGNVSLEKVDVLCTISQSISCLIGFTITGKRAKNRVGLKVVGSAVIYILIFVAMGLAAPGSQTHGTFLANWIAVIISVVLACALCIRKRKLKRTKKGRFW